jgi:hypothetical protein
MEEYLSGKNMILFDDNAISDMDEYLHFDKFVSFVAAFIRVVVVLCIASIIGLYTASIVFTHLLDNYTTNVIMKNK